MTDDEVPERSPYAPKRRAPKPNAPLAVTRQPGDLLPRNIKPIPDPTKPLRGTTPRPERQAAFHLGISAESRAAAFLIAKGYRILARRWRCPLGEIDIVARRRSTLVFVEVKARATIDEAAEAVTKRQQNRLVAAGEAWLALRPDPGLRDIRFDVVLIAPRSLPRHIQSAFDASV
jgi:putative endonuclease